MIVDQKDVSRFKSLVQDIRTGKVPWYLTDSALYAFFVENPHLLIGKEFDEHMQINAELNDGNLLTNFYPTLNEKWGRWQDEKRSHDLEPLWFQLPRLSFRVPRGQWATLISCPQLFESNYTCDLAFSFEFRLTDRASGEGLFLYEQAEVLIAIDNLVSQLEIQAKKPKENRSILWTPRLWTPEEQNRQRKLIDASIAPYIQRWKEQGICFADLNPSEFEDLIGELLFHAGLKVYKVRNAPQGGRDLIARGTLIPGEEPIEMAVEVKHRSVVDRPLVELALHQNQHYPALLFVTSGRFTAGVLEEKALEHNRFRLFLKDGEAIRDLAGFHFKLRARVAGA